MEKTKLFALLVIISLGLFSACERNDDEPVLPKTSISRLYVSFLEVTPSDLEEPYKNIAVFDPASAETFSNPFDYNSTVVQGAGIYFNAFAGKAFQGSFANQSIKTLTVNSQGAVGSGTTFRDSTLLYQRDLIYDHTSKNLYVSDNLSESIFVYSQALNRNGEVRPTKKFKLTGQPWGMHLQGDTIKGDSLFIVMAGEGKEVQLLDRVSKIDSGIVSASKKIAIAGATDLRGITYSSRLDMLVLTDFGSSKIYIIENVKEAFNTQGTITPTRIIEGGSTQLLTPIDVSIDDREDKLFIYIADNNANKIAGFKGKLLRFKTTDSGNIEPNAIYTFTKLTPISIHIDAR